MNSSSSSSGGSGKVEGKWVKATFIAIIIFGGTIFLGWSAAPAQASAAASVSSPFKYIFSTDGRVPETGSMDDSVSPYWWVNSGGELRLSGGRGYTEQGDLLSTDPWCLLYKVANALDTDSGLHPQNIFRLVTRSKWQDARQQMYFKILDDNLSDSPNRNSSNGLLLFNRYQDSATLYYTGVRVDGTAIIKKKKNGVYYTLAQKKIYPGVYNRDTNPNLLPKNTWLGIRSEVTTVGQTVSVKVYLDQNWNNRWQLVAEAIDDGSSYGGSAILNAGYGGVRTDFMDVTFDNFEFSRI